MRPARIASASCHRRSGPGRTMRRLSSASSGTGSRSKPQRPISSERMALPRLSLNVRPMAMTSPTRLHLRAELAVGARELLEREARHLHDDVVDRRLEAGRRLARDVVLDLVERVADGELRRDLRDREARRLRGERARARDARVHLDDDHLAVLRVDGELDVRAARLDADLADDGQRGVAQELVLLVGQRHRGRDGDRVARVHAHRIEVLDRADDDDVVLLVADDLELVLLPAEHATARRAPRARALLRGPRPSSPRTRRRSTRWPRPSRPS